MPSRDEYLASLHRDNELFAAALAAGGALDQPVDGCPDWTLADLVGHLGRIRHFVANTVIKRDGAGDRPAPPHDIIELVAWAADGAARLGSELAGIADDDPCWNWSVAPDTGAFWVRRMAQEAAVHRYDAEMAATTTAEAIDFALAADGIDEYVDLFIPRAESFTPIRIGEASIHLHATGDAEGEWLIRCGDHAPVVTREHAKGDVALSGAASDLLLTIWGRVDPEEVGIAVFGDPGVWTRFQSAAAI